MTDTQKNEEGGCHMCEGTGSVPNPNNTQAVHCDYCDGTGDAVQHAYSRVKHPNGTLKMPDLTESLRSVINRHSAENDSSTPDFLLTAFLVEALEAFNKAVIQREVWYGRDPRKKAETMQSVETAPKLLGGSTDLVRWALRAIIREHLSNIALHVHTVGAYNEFVQSLRNVVRDSSGWNQRTADHIIGKVLAEYPSLITSIHGEPPWTLECAAIGTPLGLFTSYSNAEYLHQGRCWKMLHTEFGELTIHHDFGRNKAWEIKGVGRKECADTLEELLRVFLPGTPIATGRPRGS